MPIVPKEGGRYRIALPWWDDVDATYRDGKFIPDGMEDDPERHFPPDLALVLEELS